MASMAFTLYHQTLRSFLSGEFQAPAVSKISAHLLVSTFEPDPTAPATLATVKAHELSSADYRPQAIAGQSIIKGDGVWSLTSDPILFGDPISLPLFRFAVLAYGHVNASAGSKPLLAYLDLSPDGNVREVVKGAFAIHPNSAGWFSITQP
jgi:hypothetical protein